MADILDIVTGDILLHEPRQGNIEPRFVGFTPLQVYEAWAADLGVNPVGSEVDGFTGDDVGVRFDLNFAPLASGGTTSFQVTSEQAINFYTGTLTSTEIGSAKSIIFPDGNSLVTRNRAYFLRSDIPSITIGFIDKPNVDAQCNTGRFRQVGNAAILYCSWTPYNSTSPINEMAMLLRDDSSIDIYCDNSEGTQSIYVLPIDSRLTSNPLVSGDALSGTVVFKSQPGETTRVYFPPVTLQPTQVSGTVTLDDQPFQSDLVVTSLEDEPRVVGTGRSDVLGNYTIDCNGWLGSVLINSVQDYGAPWAAGVSLQVGDVIHPSTPNGYIFEVNTAGVTGNVEPTWPTSAGSNVPDNTVAYTSITLLRPMIEGYVETTLV